ncbi:hypothetical protein PMAYCL1PPCAC_00928, partial [Pristionchus mayeri]
TIHRSLRHNINLHRECVLALLILCPVQLDIELGALVLLRDRAIAVQPHRSIVDRKCEGISLVGDGIMAVDNDSQTFSARHVHLSVDARDWRNERVERVPDRWATDVTYVGYVGRLRRLRRQPT